jgi:hypothetical protein
MGPKVEAACAFVNGPGRCAAIGALRDLDRIVRREAGTIIEPDPPEPDHSEPGPDPQEPTPDESNESPE